MTERFITVKEPKVKVSGLNYNNIVEDIYNLIKDNPLLEENITDYTSADSVRMLTEMFAWITDQLSQRLDIIGNELFLDTVENRENLVRILKVIGYELDFPEASSAEFDIRINNVGSDTESNLTLSYGASGGFDSETILLNESSFKKVYHSLSDSTFELIVYDKTKQVYDYFSEINIDTKTINSGIPFYEGTTSSLEFRVDTKGYFTKEITVPVIKNSIRVFYTYKDENGNPVELKRVNNFFGPEAVYSEVPIYKVDNLGNGSARIIFPKLNDVEDKHLLEIGDEITILYRTGGGTSGNIGVGEIVSTEEIWLNNNRRGYLDIRNTTRGIGGRNELTVEEIRSNAPEEIKNRLSAVTSTDYEYLLKKEDSSIKDIKVYGENNLPEDADTIGSYGFTRNPLDVWLFIIKENEKYSHSINNITDYVNDISFQTLDLNERMNEVYQVNKATLNTLLAMDEEEVLEGESEIGPHYKINIPFDFLSDLNRARANEPDKVKLAVTEEPFKVSETDITGENSDVRYLFTDSYYIEDEIEKDSKTLFYETGQENSTIELYENIPPILENNIEDGEFNGDIRVNGTVISLNNNTLSDLVDELNAKLNLILNEGYEAVILKDLIYNEDDETGISGTKEIKITHGTNDYVYKFSTDNKSYKNIINDILDAETDDGEILSDGFNIVLIDKTYEGEDCKMMIIFAKNENINNFTVTLNYEPFEVINVSSSVMALSNDEEEWEDNTQIYVTYENGLLRLINHNFEEDLKFDNTEVFRQLFGISDEYFIDGIFTLKSRRKMLISGGSLIVEIPMPKYEIKNDIYITGLWGSEDDIMLGKYYETIASNNNLGIPSAIREVLQRGPIENLYNTIALPSSEGSAEDIYNSKYEVKVTRRKINNETYFQIGETDIHTELIFSISNLPLTISGDLYLKINGENYKRNGIEVENGEDISIAVHYEDGEINQTIDNYATVENGFVVINVGKFSNKNVSVMANAIVDIFNFDSELVVLSSKDNRLRIGIVETTFYSSIDLGETSSDLSSQLFSLSGDNISIPSPNSFIKLKPIEYLKFSIADRSFISNFDLKFETLEDEFTVNTGNSLNEFKYNISSQSIGDYVEVVGNDIVLTNRNDGAYFTLTIEDSDSEKVEKAKKMFYDTAEVEVETSALPSVSITKEIEGDYYINKTAEGFKFVPVNYGKFPLGNLYFHMLEDHRVSNHLYGTEELKVYTDEHSWNNILNNKKMLCVDHNFRQPKFIPFSAIINAKISRNVSFGQKENYSKRIYDALWNRYNIYSSVLNEDIYTVDIERHIAKISGVVEANVEYLGFEPNKPLTSVKSLKARFNEKLIASSKEERTVVKKEYAIESGIKILKNEYLTVEPIQGLFIKVEYVK